MLNQYLYKNARLFSRLFFPAFFSELSLCVMDAFTIRLRKIVDAFEICKLITYQMLFITVLKNANAMPVTLGFLAKIVIWDTTRARKINLELFANLATVMAMLTSVIP